MKESLFFGAVCAAQNKTLVFPLPTNRASKLLGPILNIRFVGAKIRHRVWPREAGGLLDGEGVNRNSVPTTLSGSSLAVRGCKKIWRRSRLARDISPNTPMSKSFDFPKYRFI